MKLFIPKNYQPVLDLKQTEKAIKLVKDSFQEDLSSELRLRRVTAPLFVMQGTGINDDLNGIERPVSFPVKALEDKRAVVVHSLAKWKRLRLKQLEMEPNSGILTDMRALRPDEDFTALHSIYVDQWDWEQRIWPGDRTLDRLKDTVRKIYSALR